MRELPEYKGKIMKKIIMLALFVGLGMFVHAYQREDQDDVITYTDTKSDKKPKKKQDTNDVINQSDDVINQSAALDSLLTAEESIASQSSIPFTPIN